MTGLTRLTGGSGLTGRSGGSGLTGRIGRSEAAGRSGGSEAAEGVLGVRVPGLARLLAAPAAPRPAVQAVAGGVGTVRAVVAVTVLGRAAFAVTVLARGTAHRAGVGRARRQPTARPAGSSLLCPTM